MHIEPGDIVVYRQASLGPLRFGEGRQEGPLPQVRQARFCRRDPVRFFEADHVDGRLLVGYEYKISRLGHFGCPDRERLPVHGRYDERQRVIPLSWVVGIVPAADAPAKVAEFQAEADRLIAEAERAWSAFVAAGVSTEASVRSEPTDTR